jgi:hypothetical protein
MAFLGRGVRLDLDQDVEGAGLLFLLELLAMLLVVGLEIAVGDGDPGRSTSPSTSR